METNSESNKDLGSKKINGQEKQNDKNEGFSGENLPKDYNPSKDKLKLELEKNKSGNTKTVKRARDVNEKKAPPITESEKSYEDGEVISKSRGTKNEEEDKKTTENRDFNSDTEKGRYNTSK